MTDGRPRSAGESVWRRWRLRLGRRVRQWRGTEPRTGVQLRCEHEERGGWWLCPFVLRPGDVAYSFEVGSDLALERALLEDHGARVYIFDPDPATAVRAEREGLLEGFQLYAIRLGPENRPARRDAGTEGARMARLTDLMRMLGHRRLDLLKLNVETAPAAIQDLVDRKVDVRQLLVALEETTTTADRDRVEALVEALVGHGFRIFHITPDGRRYAFIRTDFEEL